MEPFTRKVIEIIKQIPEGQVTTYGAVAAMAGSPRSARQVVRILHSSSEKYNLPWHRVINRKGAIAIKDPAGFDEQKLLLESEGALVDSKGKVAVNTIWIQHEN